MTIGKLKKMLENTKLPEDMEINILVSAVDYRQVMEDFNIDPDAKFCTFIPDDLLKDDTEKELSDIDELHTTKPSILKKVKVLLDYGK